MVEHGLTFELLNSQGKEVTQVKSTKNLSGKRNIILISKRNLAAKDWSKLISSLICLQLKIHWWILVSFFSSLSPPDWPLLLHVYVIRHPNWPLRILFLLPGVLYLLYLVVSHGFLVLFCFKIFSCLLPPVGIPLGQLYLVCAPQIPSAYLSDGTCHTAL